MRAILVLAALMVADNGVPNTGKVMTDDAARCGIAWQQAGGATGERITILQAGRYISYLNASNGISGSRLTEAQFMEACRRGLVDKYPDAAGAAATKQPDMPAARN